MANTKEVLFEKIAAIQDQNTLDYLIELLSQINEEGYFEIKQDLDKSLSQIEKGEFETHENVIKKFLNDK